MSYQNTFSVPQWPYSVTDEIPNAMPFFGRLFEVNTRGHEDPRVLVCEEYTLPVARDELPVVCDWPGRDEGLTLADPSPIEIEATARHNWPCGSVTWLAREGNIIVGGGTLDRGLLPPDLRDRLTQGLFVQISMNAILEDSQEVSESLRRGWDGTRDQIFKSWRVQAFKLDVKPVWPDCGIRSALAVVHGPAFRNGAGL